MHIRAGRAIPALCTPWIPSASVTRRTSFAAKTWTLRRQVPETGGDATEARVSEAKVKAGAAIDAELLEVSDLEVTFGGGEDPARVLRGVSFQLRRGEALGLLGESGSGKTSLGLALLRLLPGHARVTGRVQLGELALLDLDAEALRQARGRHITMIFQQPQTALDPVQSIGRQIGEGLRTHEGLDRAARKARVAELLSLVGLSTLDPGSFPHQLSGGMQQRVLIAAALACGPAFLIADEPTTALDVVAESRILALLEQLRVSLGLALLLISHDLSVIARCCERTLVLYGGEVVEEGKSEHLLRTPAHPYTQALLAAAPRLGELARPIAGLPADPLEVAEGCRFAPRCARAEARCRRESPQLGAYQSRLVRCHFPGTDPSRDEVAS